MMDYETTDVLNRVVWAPMPYTKHHVEVHESEVIPYACSLPTNSANLTVLPFLMAHVLTFSRNGDRQTNNPTQPIQPSIQPSNLPSNDLPSNAHYNGPLGPSHIKHQRRSKELATRLQQRKYECNMTPRVLENICWFAVGRNHLIYESYITHIIILGGRKRNWRAIVWIGDSFITQFDVAPWRKQ